MNPPGRTSKNLPSYVSVWRHPKISTMLRVKAHTITKKPRSPVLEINNSSWIAKVQTIPQNPYRMMQKPKNNNNNKLNCTLHGPGHDMNYCKVIQAQDNYTKGN